MLKRKFKTVISALLMAVITLSLIACGKEEVVEPEVEVEFAEHQVSMYLIDAWKKQNADTKTDEYHTTLLVNSDSFFAEPTLDNFEYLVGSEYKKLTDSVELNYFNIYHMANGDVPGICTYVHFVTNELIDLKKVFVTVLGAEEKDKIGFERIAYKDEFGSLDGFVEIAAGVEEREVPLSQVLPLQTNVDENVIVLWDENESKFYYKNNPQALFLEETAAYMMLEVDPLTNSELSLLADAFVKEGKVGDYKDGKFVEWEDSEDFTIFSKVDRDYVAVGYNVNSLSKYDVIPTAISLTSNGHEYIVRLFE